MFQATLTPYVPHLFVMGVMMFLSAFFSASEAACFSLTATDKNDIATRGKTGRQLERLLNKPEQLLTAILLGNLFVNLLFFTLSSIITFSLQRHGEQRNAGIFVVASLAALIIFCEILPKTIAVLIPKTLSLLLTIPLTMFVYLFKPLLPLLRNANILSRRLLFPQFQAEPYLQISDLERIFEHSKDDTAMLRRQQSVLQSIVQLSELRADELMRPRPLLKTFTPPVTLDDVFAKYDGELPMSGYVLITESETDEIASAVSLGRLKANETDAVWQANSAPVLYVPWSVSVAEVLEQMCGQGHDVAAVVNEYGETIGILIFDDVLETLFTREPNRPRRLHNLSPLKKVGQNRWHANGLTSLRYLSRHLHVSLPFHESVTLAGLLHEILERLPESGDVCNWGPFVITVIEVSEADRTITAELRMG
ncbi:MAG: CNNM domain-containing protein [Planctomycetaceae bacterium]|nr:CNNM domain-containing protein [Planctomycetaceae bacterium]